MIFDLCGDNVGQWEYVGNNFDLRKAEMVMAFRRYDDYKESEAMRLNEKKKR
jgi:hypothetical protein